MRHIDFMTVKKLKEGDAKAFDTLFLKYGQRLFNFSVKYLKSTEEAEGVVQDVFLYVWEKRSGLKPESSFNAYLFAIAYNIIRKHFNKRSKENAYKDDLLYEMLKQDNNLDQIIDYRFLLQKVESIIALLPERRQVFCFLYYLCRFYESLLGL
jgi:RNA polymerase sigma factor (sigma-70 family)